MSRPGAAERLGRLLAVVPWIASQDGPTIAEVCERFEMSESELLADMNLLFMCGVYPFTPDTLIEVDVNNGRVWIRFADWFRRPLRLTAAEGLTLVTAASALLAVPGADPDGALARALAKLSSAIGVPPDDAVEVDLGNVPTEMLATLNSARSGRHKVRISYYSSGRDKHATRVVQPWRVFNAQGQWYLSGYCELAEDERLFRVDRIMSAEATEESFELPLAIPEPETYRADASDPVVTLDLSPEASWIVERYPFEKLEPLDGGGMRVTLRSSGQAWLERLLLRAGKNAKMVSGPSEVPTEAARRLLSLYRPVLSSG